MEIFIAVANLIRTSRAFPGEFLGIGKSLITSYSFIIVNTKLPLLVLITMIAEGVGRDMMKTLNIFNSVVALKFFMVTVQ